MSARERRSPLADTDAVKRGLQDRILDLCATLLAGGKSDQTHWLAGSLAGEAGQSLRVMLTRGNEGRFKDFASGESGNVLQLVKSCLYGSDRTWDRTLQWATWWLGWAEASPEELTRLKEEAELRRVQAAREAEDRTQKYRQAARRIFFSQSEAPIDGTPAEAYLRGRGINPLLWQSNNPGWPKMLRYCPELLHGKSGLIAPALVAAIAGHDGAIIAVHRTWLEPDREGGWRKVAALGREAKMTLGSYKDTGGYIRLRRGATGRPWKTPEPGETVHVTEGIEDALTLAMAVPEARIACAVSISSLANARFPDGISTLRIWADNDPPGSAAAEGLLRARKAQQGRGLTVNIDRPPSDYKDLNEWLRGIRGT